MTKAAKFMGTACKYAHDGLRYESTGACVHCALLSALRQKQKRKAALIPAEPLPVGQAA